MGRKKTILELIPVKVFREEIDDQSKQERKSLVQDLHILHRDSERGNVSDVEYCKKRNELESKIRELTKQRIFELKKVQKNFLKKQITLNKEENNDLNKGENNMAKQVEVKKELPKRARTDSIAAVIEKVLMMKSIKSIDKTVDKIKELKPDVNEKNVKNQINTIIRIVKKGEKPRWKNYKFDDETYLLEKVE